jgi:hypothetical protein
MSNITLYYLEPDFKYTNLIVPFIILVLPICFIIFYIIKGNSENFQNKDLENNIIKKHETDTIETNNNVDWDIIEYINDKYNELKNYIKKRNIINNDNGSKSINLRYNGQSNRCQKNWIHVI